MGAPPPRGRLPFKAHRDLPGAVHEHLDPMVEIPPHRQNLAGVGMCTVLFAPSLTFGLVGDVPANSRTFITLARPCGCNQPGCTGGMALIATPPPEQARRIAAQLIANADKQEAAAAAASREVLARAARK